MYTHTSPGRAPTAPTAVAALVAAAACWGTGTVASKQVVDDVAPLTLLPMQLAASCILLLVITLVRRERFTWTKPFRRLAALGVLNPGIAYALGLVGLTTITASMSVLLWALEPVVIMLLAALVLHEHIPLPLAAAVGVALSGVLLVVYQPGATGDAVGITLTVVSIGFCALYSVLTRRLLLDDSALTVVLAQQVAALVVRHCIGHVRLDGRRDRLGPGRPRCRRLAGCCGVRRLVLRTRVLVLRHRPPAGTGLGGRVVHAAHPGIRPGGRVPRRGAAGAAAVGRRSRHLAATAAIAIRQRTAASGPTGRTRLTSPHAQPAHHGSGWHRRNTRQGARGSGHLVHEVPPGVSRPRCSGLRPTGRP